MCAYKIGFVCLPKAFYTVDMPINLLAFSPLCTYLLRTYTSLFRDLLLYRPTPSQKLKWVDKIPIHGWLYFYFFEK